MKSVLIIGTSLNKDSRSQILAKKFEVIVKEANYEVNRIDLRNTSLPFAGSAEGWESKAAEEIARKISVASHIVFAVPIYCYDVNAVAKNLIELTGKNFAKKVVSFICSAGGAMSYMSVMGMANHLMLDFRSVIVPRFLYTHGGHWEGSDEVSEEILKRMELLLEDMASIEVKVD